MTGSKQAVIAKNEAICHYAILTDCFGHGIFPGSLAMTDFPKNQTVIARYEAICHYVNLRDCFGYGIFSESLAMTKGNTIASASIFPKSRTMTKILEQPRNDFNKNKVGFSNKKINFTSMERGGAIYFMTNKNNTTIYVGVTSKLKERIYSHKNNLIPGSFTARYNLHKFVYYELFHSIEEAILREKQLKAGSRSKKTELVTGLNPEWADLFEEILKW